MTDRSSIVSWIIHQAREQIIFDTHETIKENTLVELGELLINVLEFPAQNPLLANAGQQTLQALTSTKALALCDVIEPAVRWLCEKAGFSNSTKTPFPTMLAKLFNLSEEDTKEINKITEGYRKAKSKIFKQGAQASRETKIKLRKHEQELQDLNDRFPLGQFIAICYMWRNIEAHEAPVLTSRDRTQLLESFCIFLLRATQLHQETFKSSQEHPQPNQLSVKQAPSPKVEEHKQTLAINTEKNLEPLHIYIDETAPGIAGKEAICAIVCDGDYKKYHLKKIKNHLKNAHPLPKLLQASVLPVIMPAIDPSGERVPYEEQIALCVLNILAWLVPAPSQKREVYVHLELYGGYKPGHRHPFISDLLIAKRVEHPEAFKNWEIVETTTRSKEYELIPYADLIGYWYHKEIIHNVPFYTLSCRKLDGFLPISESTLEQALDVIAAGENADPLLLSKLYISSKGAKYIQVVLQQLSSRLEQLDHGGIGLAERFLVCLEEEVDPLRFHAYIKMIRVLFEKEVSKKLLSIQALVWLAQWYDRQTKSSEQTLKDAFLVLLDKLNRSRPDLVERIKLLSHKKIKLLTTIIPNDLKTVKQASDHNQIPKSGKNIPVQQDQKTTINESLPTTKTVLKTTQSTVTSQELISQIRKTVIDELKKHDQLALARIISILNEAYGPRWYKRCGINRPKKLLAQFPEIVFLTLEQVKLK